MSDSDDDLFGGGSSDGGDTDELIAASKKTTKPLAKKKAASKPRKLLQKPKKKDASIPDADADDGSDDDDDDEATGLFDSDDDDDETEKAKTKQQKPKQPKKILTKREKMEALKKKARKAAGITDDAGPKRKKGDGEKGRSAAEKKEKGYDSGDSYNSGTGYDRNQDDDDFIDVEGEDEDAVREYYAEQHFEDERPDGEEEELAPAAKKKAYAKKRSRGPDTLDAEADADNPIVAAVNRMKKKKKVARTPEDSLNAAQEFVQRMENAADEDELAIKEKRPGMKKLQLLPEAVDMMTNREMIRPLLETDVLTAVKRWIQPLPDGSLGNVTVRHKMLDVIAKMGTGEETGIDTEDLKRSGFGKLVMTLYMHKSETPAMKKQLNALIQQWSRIIFGKSGNMKDLAGAQATRRRSGGMAASASSPAAASMNSSSSAASNNFDGDLGAVMLNGVKQGRDLGKNRVRIPYSKGFQYTVRPSHITGDVTDKKTRISTVKEKRESLHKRMLEKNRPVNKNNRSANISIEGRPTK